MPKSVVLVPLNQTNYKKDVCDLLLLYASKEVVSLGQSEQVIIVDLEQNEEALRDPSSIEKVVEDMVDEGVVDAPPRSPYNEG